MRNLWSLWIILAMAAMANAQITKTATFENYVPDTFFKPSFTDTLSGITFFNSSQGGFVVDSDLYDKFNNSNYLTAVVGGNDGFGGDFSFTANLPEPSNQVGIDVVYYNSNSNYNVTLEGLDSSDAVIAQQAYSTPGVFALEVSSIQYNITSFQVVVDGGYEGYDNISFTYLPEPSALTGLLGIVVFRRRK